MRPRDVSVDPLEIPTVPRGSRFRVTSLTADRLGQCTDGALGHMFKEIERKGHLLQLVDSPTPCLVRAAAIDLAMANSVHWVGLVSPWDKAKFPGQPFSLHPRDKRSYQLSAHVLSAEIYGRVNALITQPYTSRRGREEKIESSHLCKIAGCAAPGHVIREIRVRSLLVHKEYLSYPTIGILCAFIPTMPFR